MQKQVIYCQCQISVFSIAIAIIAYDLANVSLAFVSFEGIFLLLIHLLASIYLFYVIRILLLQGSNAIVAFQRESNGLWTLYDAKSKPRENAKLTNYFMSDYVIILYFNYPGYTEHLFIPRDSIPDPKWHCLKMIVLYDN